MKKLFLLTLISTVSMSFYSQQYDLNKADNLYKKIESNIDNSYSYGTLTEEICTDFSELYWLLVTHEKIEQEYLDNKLSKSVIHFLHKIDRITIMQGLYRAALESSYGTSTETQKIREVFLDKMSEQINMMSLNSHSLYNFHVRKKKIIKALFINTSNDVLSPFQKNNDMDFTGAVKIGVATDYLKINWDTQIKSYQVLSYGFEVYTPYYKIDSIFNHDTSYNKSDRPHASFSYIGLESNWVSTNYWMRYNLELKLGEIGGKIGGKFQTVVHQDITSSLRPKGWGAQIANPGRLGISLEFRPEILLTSEKNRIKLNDNSKWFFPSVTGDFAIGSYMTYGGIGFQFSNKNFRSSNQHYMNVMQTEERLPIFSYKHLNFNFHARYRYIMHNSMLEGYGYYKTIEGTEDILTPKSKHSLREDQVRRFMQYYDLTVSIQKRHFSVFYKSSVKSPEVKNMPGIVKNTDGDILDLNNRWHHYSTLGLIFIIN